MKAWPVYYKEKISYKLVCDSEQMVEKKLDDKEGLKFIHGPFSLSVCQYGNIVLAI